MNGKTPQRMGATLNHGHLSGLIGWIDHGKLAPLKPASTSIEDEAW